jgi:alpha-amylase
MTNRFSAPSWAHATNIYEVNIRQYTAEGTFNAFLPHLPRLKEMGVETLWFMPITPISRKNRKGALGSYYACSDYTSINPEFGTLDDFILLVKKSHELGFKVIIDWVANHTGWDHRWTMEHPDFYILDTATNDFRTASGMDDIIELDFSNPELVQEMIEAMQYWITIADIDGFRCDLAAWVELPFWQQARTALEKVKKLLWLGEFDELDNPDYGNVFDISYSWQWMHRTKDFYTGQLSPVELDTLLSRYYAIGDNSMRAWFTSNHDENSWNGTEYEKYGMLAPVLAVFSCTWNGIPLIYNGQELPLKDKRLAFFEKDIIPWETPLLHDFYKKLLQLHASHPALRGGDPVATTHILKPLREERVLVYLRKNEQQAVLVILNFSGTNHSIHLEHEALNGNYENVFSGEMIDFPSAKGIDLESWGFEVYVFKG